MPLKVTWKKGMRLSTDVFDALDAYIDENIRQSNIIATGGRFGLIPVNNPFELSVNVGNNVVEVVSLSCHGLTRSGKIVDIEFDSNYSGTFDTRVSMPSSIGDESFLLVVKYHDKQWREVNDIYSEPYYTFELVNINSTIDNDSLPIGLIVNQYGWRLDETQFVPPCLYTSAHPKFEDMAIRAKLVLKSISDICLNSQNCVARHLLGSIWTAATENYLFIDKNHDALSPIDLFTSIQKVVASFTIGCSIDEYVTLENSDPFVEYFHRPYDLRNLYRNIQDGLALCAEISTKMDAVCAMTEVREAPTPPVEKPKSKPQPAQEVKTKGHNRWEGIEI